MWDEPPHKSSYHTKKGKSYMSDNPNTSKNNSKKYYLQYANDVLSTLNTSPEGLSSEEAAKRTTEYGSNELEAPPGKSILRKFVDELMDPMIIILIAAAIISAVLAVVENESFADVIIIISVVIINSCLGVYQESKAEKAIEALQEMSKATSKVFRDGKLLNLLSNEIVPGDIVLMEAGDSVPADGRIIDSASLKVEESALTGESVAVDKDSATLSSSEDSVPLCDRTNMVYMGSSVAYGRASVVITDTGMNTEMGKIANAIAQAADEETPLQKKLSQLSKILTFLVLGICAVVFAVQLIRAGQFETKVILNSLIVAVSLAVAAIPEGLAAVVTIVLSIGVTNMSKRNAIIRKLTAVETLGCASVICSDKTGTLTQNKMTVVDKYTENDSDMALCVALASEAQINQDLSVTGEPTEVGLSEWAVKTGITPDTLSEGKERVGELPFDSVRKMMTVIIKDAKTNTLTQYTKGAPDVIIGRCDRYLEGGEIKPLSAAKRNELLKANKDFADRALRVIACSVTPIDTLTEPVESDRYENNMVFAGLLAMIDPVRPEVKPAIDKCESAGIRPIMITGDHVDTASAIGRELGILKDGMRAVTGSELDKMDDDTFAKEFDKISVYARVQPEHKTRIVKQWQDTDHVTAMTGDGVNDAPAIKTADIGVGMGITGTDVTKNVADMVLTDDNFATIVGAVEEGRRVYDNIRKAIQFLLGSNMSEVVCIFAATLLGFTILKPVHLLWINLITDSLPALALGMEFAEADIMKRKPRPAKAGIFSEGMGIDIIYQGLLVAVITLVSYFAGVYTETGAIKICESGTGITMAFITLSLCEIFHSFNLRSRTKSLFGIKKQNKMLFLSGFIALTITTLVCEVDFLNNAFDLVKIDLKHYLIAIAISITIIPAVEIVKLIKRLVGKNI